MQQAANLQQATILQAAALSAATQNPWNQPGMPSQTNPANDLSKSTTDAQQKLDATMVYHSSIFDLLIFFSHPGLTLVTMHHKSLPINNGTVSFFFSMILQSI